jgi:hypothetical protein
MRFEHWGSTAAERASEVPGDDLIVAPQMNATRCISVADPPDVVFEWLAQMGTGRAGWYSYDLIDNFARPSASRLYPEWAVRNEGESIPAGPISFSAAVVERPHRFVMSLLGAGAPGHTIDFTLGYRLDPLPNGTRIVSRARARVDGPLGLPAALALRLGDTVMVRRQLIGLARRCGGVVESA